MTTVKPVVKVYDKQCLLRFVGNFSVIKMLEPVDDFEVQILDNEIISLSIEKKCLVSQPVAQTGSALHSFIETLQMAYYEEIEGRVKEVLG